MAGEARQLWQQGEALMPGLTEAMHPAFARSTVSGHARGVGHHVVLKPRPDLFVETNEELVTDDGKVLKGIQNFAANSVTSIPDNLGCVEVVGVGDLVDNVKPGEIVLLDFFDCDQGFQIANSDHYVALDHVFRAKFHPETGTMEPLAGYVLTKRNSDRMKIALNGTDRVEVPDYILTDGIPSGWDSDGVPLLHSVYEEVVAVGPPPTESKTRPLHRLERELLDMLLEQHMVPENVSEYDEYGAEMAQAIERYIRWRRAPRAIDLKPGDLVPFCTEFRVKLRVRGQFLSLVPQDQCLGVIDDAAILDAAIRAGKAGKLVVNRGGPTIELHR